MYVTGYSLLLSAVATSVVGLGYWLVAARLYPAASVGESAALISALQLVAAPAWVAQNAVLIRFLPAAGEKSGRLISRAYTTAVLASVPLAVAAVAIGPALSPALELLSSTPAWWLAFVVCVAMWSVFSLQDAAMTAMGQAQWVPLENVVYAAAKLALLAVLAGALPASGIFVAWNLPLGALIVMVNVFLFARLVPVHRRGSVADPIVKDLRALVSYGTSNWAGTLLTLAPVMLIPILVASELGSRQNAFFYIPWTIAVNLPVIGASMTTALTVEGAFGGTSLRRIVRSSARHTAVLLVPLVALILVAAPLILQVFGSGYADEGSAVLRLLALAALPLTVVQFAVAVARVRRRTSVIFLTQAMSALLSVGLTVLLIHDQGIRGPAIAWLIAQTATAVVAGTWLFRVSRVGAAERT
jgi:O-antigen/teichoic acid export membrane protein